MKLIGWFLFIGGSILSVMNCFMLSMQTELWLMGRSSSWPPMGLGILFWGDKLNTGWACLDEVFNSHIPTALIAFAALIGLGLAILGMKTIDRLHGTR